MKRKIIQIISHLEPTTDFMGENGEPREMIYGLANDGTLWWHHEDAGWLSATRGVDGYDSEIKEEATQ